MGEHGVSVARSKAAWLSAEVKEDSIGFPMAEGPNSCFVDAGDKEGGGAPGAEAVGFDAIWGDIHKMKDGGGGTAQFKVDVARGDVIGSIGGVIVAVERAGGRCIVLAKVLNTITTSGQHRAEKTIAQEAMSERLAMGGIHLISVDKGHIGPLLHVIPRTVTSRDALDERAAESDVCKAERFAAAMISSMGQCVFPRSAKEIEGNDTKVKDHMRSVLVYVEGETHHQGVKDGNVDGPDPSRSRVGIGPRLEEGL
jgi:hypothetical protein